MPLCAKQVPGRTDEIGEIATQDVVARVAAVVTELDVHVVAPRLAEPVPGEVADVRPSPLTGSRCASALAWSYPERRHRDARRMAGDGAAGIGLERTCSQTASHDATPTTIATSESDAGMARPT